MPIEYLALPYARTALEPHLSAATLETHHGVYHRSEVERLNARMAGVKLPAVASVQRAGAADDASAIGAAIIPFLDHILPSESILMQAGR